MCIYIYESRHTYKPVISRIRISHVFFTYNLFEHCHMNEPRHASEPVMSHIRNHVSLTCNLLEHCHMNKSCHTHKRVMPHIQTSHVFLMCNQLEHCHVNKSSYTYERVLSHRHTSHVTYTNESYLSHFQPVGALLTLQQDIVLICIAALPLPLPPLPFPHSAWNPPPEIRLADKIVLGTFFFGLARVSSL